MPSNQYPYVGGFGLLVNTRTSTSHPVGIRQVTGQFNAMIAPIIRFPIKGVIWYQGCLNGGESDTYADKMETLVGGWRKAWGYVFPFYWVQLASLSAPTDDPEGAFSFSLRHQGPRHERRCLPVFRSWRYGGFSPVMAWFFDADGRFQF